MPGKPTPPTPKPTDPRPKVDPRLIMNTVKSGKPAFDTAEGARREDGADRPDTTP